MPIEQKYMDAGEYLARDIRPGSVRFKEWLSQPNNAVVLFGVAAVCILILPEAAAFADVLFVLFMFYFMWLRKLPEKVPLKLPAHATQPDINNGLPGSRKPGKAEGILYIGNAEKGEELWLTNADARTHILMLGTTGSGKTEALKSLVTNALTWGSGFIYVDGKADTDLWASLYALARRFGRDDDLLLLNYMTGNSDLGSASNSLNPFSAGSASYLTNLMVSLMPEAEGDNAMWKDRAVALLGSLMPALTWKRDNQGLQMDVGVIRDHLELPAIVRLSRTAELPPKVTKGLQGYLKTLPGYDDNAYDDNGNARPAGPDEAPHDTTTANQQHGYLSMQFTRALASLADDYGYVFGAQLADVDMMDVVLNRRILVVLLPALEKSPDEAANLGKITAATLKGMMGSTLGATVEGGWEQAIENKPTRAPSPFMTVFDEVGYYTTEGMGVMAAQARSLGFSLIFAAQDLPALEKRVKQEARSITGNCNLKLFGKIEDPTDTKDFFEKTVGQTLVAEASGFSMTKGGLGSGYMDRMDASMQMRPKARYSELKKQREGQVVVTWANKVFGASLFYANPPRVPAIRVQKFLAVSADNIQVVPQDKAIDAVLQRFRDPDWVAAKAAPPAPVVAELQAMAEGFAAGIDAKTGLLEAGALAVANLAALIAVQEEDERAGLIETVVPKLDIAAGREVPGAIPTPPDQAPSWTPDFGDFAAPPSAPMPPASAEPDRPLSWADVAGGFALPAGEADEPAFAGHGPGERPSVEESLMAAARALSGLSTGSVAQGLETRAHAGED